MLRVCGAMRCEMTLRCDTMGRRRHDAGYVDASRVTLLLRACGEAPSEERVVVIVSQVQARGGKASFDDFVQMVRETRAAEGLPSLPAVEAAFRVFDPTASGFIHRDELKRVLMTYGEKLDEAEFEDILKVAEVDDRGRILYAQFAKKLMA